MLPPIPGLQDSFVERQEIVREFVEGISVDSTGGITGFDFDTMNRSMGTLAQQIANE